MFPHHVPHAKHPWASHEAQGCFRSIMLQRKPSLQVRFSKLLWLCTKFCAFLASPSPWKESKGNRARFLFAGSRVEGFRRRGKRNPRLLNVSLVTFSTPRKSPHRVTGSRSLQMSQARPPHYRKTPVPRKKWTAPVCADSTKSPYVGKI